VYADWLEERDDPRGRYLRSEIELAGLSPKNPVYLTLEAEFRTLRADFALDWLQQAGKQFDVVLSGDDPRYKNFVIKRIRAVMWRPLPEVAQFVEVLPTLVLRGVNRHAAEVARQLISSRNGAEVAQVLITLGETSQARPATLE
jgi:ribosomal protein L7/L12